jgi:hypothetical protein
VKTRIVVRLYPSDWSIAKISDFMGTCRRQLAIPANVKPKVITTRADKRKGMTRVQWKWKVGR